MNNIYFIFYLSYFQSAYFQRFFKFTPATIACPKDTDPSPGHELMCWINSNPSFSIASLICDVIASL